MQTNDKVASDRSKRICDVHSDDVEFLKLFNEQVQMLTGMVKEIIEDEPKLLFSPVMRKLLADKAKEVNSLHGPLLHRLCVDNPGEPLKPWNRERS